MKTMKMLVALLIAVLLLGGASAVAEIASGTSGTCAWEISDVGVLTIKPAEGESGQLIWDSNPPWYANRADIKSVQFQGNIQTRTCYQMFVDCKNLKRIDFTGFSTSGVESMYRMFKNCTRLEDVDVNQMKNWDVSTVRDISEMFNGCQKIKTLDLSGWEVGLDVNTYRWHPSNLRRLILGERISGKMSIPTAMFEVDDFRNRDSDIMNFEEVWRANGNRGGYAEPTNRRVTGPGDYRAVLFVSFHPNGGDGYPEFVYDDWDDPYNVGQFYDKSGQVFLWGEPAKPIRGKIYKREGYRFLGWSMSSTLDGWNSELISGMVSFDLLTGGDSHFGVFWTDHSWHPTCPLFAIWEEGAEDAVITYDPNGGILDGSSDPVNEIHGEGTTITIREAPTREGYKFLYWKGSEYQPGDQYTVEADHTFVAQWEKEAAPTPTPEPKYPFTFTKVWQGEVNEAAQFTLYKKDGTVYKTYTGKDMTKKGNTWTKTVYLREPADYYVQEGKLMGYQIKYENGDASVADRCLNGGTILNAQIPRTGDSASIILWLALTGAAMAGLAAVGAWRKKTGGR